MLRALSLHWCIQFTLQIRLSPTRVGNIGFTLSMETLSIAQAQKLATVQGLLQNPKSGGVTKHAFNI